MVPFTSYPQTTPPLCEVNRHLRCGSQWVSWMVPVVWLGLLIGLWLDARWLDVSLIEVELSLKGSWLEDGVVWPQLGHLD